VIQVRHKGGTDRDLLDFTRRVLQRDEGLDVTVLVDDRLDIAAAAGAHGVAVVSAISQAADPYAVTASFLRALQGAA